VESAKQLEKNRRDLCKKLEKDKAAQTAREHDLREATIAMDEAQKKVWAAQQAKRTQASMLLALEVLSRPAPHPHRSLLSNLSLSCPVYPWHACSCACVCCVDVWCCVQAEMQEVVREQKESNDRLAAQTKEFHVLLAKNSASA